MKCNLGGKKQYGANFLVKENNTMAGTRPQAATFRFEVQCTTHYTTAEPP